MRIAARHADSRTIVTARDFDRHAANVVVELVAGTCWVGIPNARLQVHDQVVREQVSAHPGVVFVDTCALFSGRNAGRATSSSTPAEPAAAGPGRVR